MQREQFKETKIRSWPENKLLPHPQLYNLEARIDDFFLKHTFNKLKSCFGKWALSHPQLYNLEAGIEDHKNRVKNAANTRKDIEAVFKTVSDANKIVQVLLTDDMKAELNQQVEELKERGSVNDKIEDRLKAIDDFNGKIKIYIGVLVELEKWNLEGRKRMDELLAGPAPGSSAEDRVLMTMELGEDISKQLELHTAQEVNYRPLENFAIFESFVFRPCGMTAWAPRKLGRSLMSRRRW